MAVGPQAKEVRVGDWCLLEVESSDIARMYDNVLQVLFTDGDSEMFEMVSEPVIKETVEDYWRNSDKDSRLTALTLAGDTIQFLCSDVLHFTVIQTSTPEYHLLYPCHTRMFELDGQLYYEVNEQDILGVFV